MATSQGQYIVRCQLCHNPVEHHCNLCHVDLCSNCISTHMADKSKRHKVVDFINRKEGPVLPGCQYHVKTLCEMYCNDCQEATCVLCVTTRHKKHDITDINSILENLKQRIISDIEELKIAIIPKYRTTVVTGVDSTEFDKIINAIQEQEDNICKVVRKIGRQLKDEVVKQKIKFEQKSKEIQSSAARTGKELSVILQTNKRILESNDATSVLNYQSRNENFRCGPKRLGLPKQMFVLGLIKQSQLQEMFGFLRIQHHHVAQKKLGKQNLMPNPVVVYTIQSPYVKSSRLWRVLVDKSKHIWISGSDSTIYQIDKRGSKLKTISPAGEVLVLSLNMKNELIFSLWGQNTTVYRHNDIKKRTELELFKWTPRGICHSANGDHLLVSMRSVDLSKSRVVRYFGKIETMIIQNDKHGGPLFSVGTIAVLLLTENGNADVCVADYESGSVVVVDAIGELRFKCRKNVSTKSRHKSFSPINIATDVNHNILINDSSYDIVHVIDSDGHFLRYVEFPCNGGLSIDRDHNLVVGDETTGKIRIIKYLQ